MTFLSADKVFFEELVSNFPALILRTSFHDLFLKVVFNAIKFELEHKMEQKLAEYQGFGMNLYQIACSYQNTPSRM
jgi:hypothetical protein